MISVFLPSWRRSGRLCREPHGPPSSAASLREPRAWPRVCPCVCAAGVCPGSAQCCPPGGGPGAGQGGLPAAAQALARDRGQAAEKQELFLAELQDRDKQTREPQLRGRLQGQLLFHGLLVRSAAAPRGEQGCGGHGRGREKRGGSGGVPTCFGASPAPAPSCCPFRAPCAPAPQGRSWRAPRSRVKGLQVLLWVFGAVKSWPCAWGPPPSAPPGQARCIRQGLREKPRASDTRARSGAVCRRGHSSRKGPPGQGGGAHLFSAGFTPTDSEAMAVTVSASSFSHFWASTRECPTVEQRRGRERQYWPGAREELLPGVTRLPGVSSRTPPGRLEEHLSRGTEAGVPPGSQTLGSPTLPAKSSGVGPPPRLGHCPCEGASHADPLRWDPLRWA